MSSLKLRVHAHRDRVGLKQKTISATELRKHQNAATVSSFHAGLSNYILCPVAFYLTAVLAG